MCTAANVYVNITYKPAFCPFLAVHATWSKFSRGRSVQNDNPFDDSFYNTFQCKTLDYKNMGFSQEHFR